MEKDICTSGSSSNTGVEVAVSTTSESSTSCSSERGWSNTGRFKNCFSRPIKNFDEAKEIVLYNVRDWIIRAAFKLKDGYLFSIAPDMEAEIVGGFYKVSYEGEMEEYSPVMDPQEFKEALKNPIL